MSGDNRSRELYATQRLIDLYLGPLGDDMRALVELRRLVERNTGVRQAAVVSASARTPPRVVRRWMERRVWQRP